MSIRKHESQGPLTTRAYFAVFLTAVSSSLDTSRAASSTSRGSSRAGSRCGRKSGEFY